MTEEVSGMSFPTILKHLRVEAEMSQSELGAVLHVTQQTIARWERGLSEPNIGMLVELARVFHVSLEDLLGVCLESGKIGECWQVCCGVFSEGRKPYEVQDMVTWTFTTKEKAVNFYQLLRMVEGCNDVQQRMYVDIDALHAYCVSDRHYIWMRKVFDEHTLGEA
ncbi:MAG: helix-turn-helix domain-containing protein [Selenomonadaceae bacterium]|nr:helix-turn-helix domain-containing protein [Selenomonadaceae bacterium]